MWVHESEPTLAGLGVRRTAGSEVNGAAAALEEILPKNGTTGETELDGLLRSALGINRAQFAAAR